MRAALLALLLLGAVATIGCGGGSADPAPVQPTPDPGGEPPVGDPDPGDPGPGDPDPGGGPPVSPGVPDAFRWTGNTRLTTFPLNGLRANDPPDVVIVAADATSKLGGAVSVNLATGAFTYDPPPGAQNAVDEFTYTVRGHPPVPVTVELRERIWWVRADDPGADAGTDRAPFRTLAQAEAASDEDDTIFVFVVNPASPTDAGQDRGITLQPGQRLLGKGVGIRVEGVPLVDPFPKARISNRAAGAPGQPVVRLSTRNEVAGFSIDAASGDGILGVGGEGHLIRDNAVAFTPAAGGHGIRLLRVTGSHVVTRNTVAGSPRAGIAVANDEDENGAVAAAVAVAGAITLSDNDVSGSALDGISVRLGGAGTAVALDVLTNRVLSSGGSGAGGGVAVRARGAASLAVAVSRNDVSGSAGEAVALAADGGASLAAYVANNDLASGVADELRGSVDGSASAGCLELIANRNATARVVNAGGTLQLFEEPAAPEDAAFREGTVVDVLHQACGVAPNGAALFEANCGGCHAGNGLGGRRPVGPDITGYTAARILSELAVNPTMSFIRLTEPEIEAIANALAPQQ